jgi:hypothetical protein
MQDQVEIIKVNGDIEFHDLDASRGITNIGQHPDNDIVIDSPDVAPFHAILDHRQRPYQFMLLSPMGQTRLSGQALSQNVSVDLTGWDTIEMNGHTLILIEAETFPGQRPPSGTREVTTAVALVPVGSRISEPQAAAEAIPAADAVIAVDDSLQPTTAAVALVSEAGALGLAKLPPDERDENIILELEEREWAVEAGQSISFQITIGNGGSLVASFEVWVEGIGPSWVEIIPPQINLNEGARSNVTISITPPRHPTSRAGAHYFSVTVTSANYPGRRSRVGGALTINPYYQFNIGELSPKEQNTNWFRPVGQATLSVYNRGNSAAPFRLEGFDTQQGCSFEFTMPGETVSLANQAEFRLPSEETATIPIRIIPHTRPLFVRRQDYSFTISTTLVEGGQTPLSVLGQLRVKSLIRLWHILLAILLLTGLLSYLFRPQTRELLVNNAITDQVILAGTPVSIAWDASRFAVVSLECKGQGECPPAGQVPQPVGQVTAMPTGNAVYVLKARNLLSEVPIVGPALFRPSLESPSIFVTPVRPDIRVFSVDRNNILTGESVLLSWEVSNASELELRTNGNPETLLSTEHTSQRAVELSQGANFVLVARNQFGEDTDNLQVNVIVPTFTPTATPQPPAVQMFNVDPLMVTQGDSVTIDWVVTEVDSVAIAPVSAELPPNGSISHLPDTTLQYILTASNGNPNQDVRLIREVIVNTPTPTPTGTPEPEKPVIEFFQATEDEVVLGDDEEIELSWSVIGETTNIQITSPNFGPVSGLPAFGNVPITPEETTLFVLTAFNGDLSASETFQLKVLEPTPTPEPPPPPTPTPLPPSIVFFRAESGEDPAQPDEVIPTSPGQYTVQEGSRVRFSWFTQNVSKVTFQGDAQPFEGNQILSVRQSGTYELVAFGEADPSDTVSAFIQLTVRPAPPPPPPFAVSGIDSPTNDPPIMIRWRYSSQFVDKIIGFRIYRADISDNIFSRVVDEGDLAPTDEEWIDDTVSPACGKIYYVVAVYEDLDGNLQETDSSTTTWIAKPCP